LDTSAYFIFYLYIFFFQAEDGIRDRNVTGVQTCALPISVTLTGEATSTVAFSAPAVNKALAYISFVTSVIFSGVTILIVNPFPSSSRVILAEENILELGFPSI